MKAINSIFVFSLFMSVAIIQGEPSAPTKVKAPAQSKVETPVDVLEEFPVIDRDGEDPQELLQDDITIQGSCSNPEAYKGQSLCYPAGQYCGECVSFVKVCTKDYRTTANWVRGTKVKGASISRGTAIATFPNGKYSGHAAIYISQNGDGIQVWDQWVGHPVSQRTIRWNGSGVSNNGDSFYVIN